MSGVMRSWPMPTELPDEPERFPFWVQVLSGVELDRDGGVHDLSAVEWQQRREYLAALGGPPLP